MDWWHLRNYFVSCALLGNFDELVDPIIVILNLAPASLFFMVVLTYVSATADIAKIGALVHQSRTVESLAQVDVLCFAKAGFLTGIGFQLQLVENDESYPEIALPRIKQILGDFAQSTTGMNPTIRALAANFPGTQRNLKESAPFLSAYGWSAVVFDDDDLQGLYVLAEADVLELDLQGSNAEDENGQDMDQQEHSITKSITSAIRNPFSRFGNRNKKKPDQPEQELDEPTPAVSETEETGEGNEVVNPERENHHGRFSLRHIGSRLTGRVSSLINRDDSEPQDVLEEKEKEAENLLVFAYSTEAESLDINGGEWQLPDNLIPLCRISFEEQVKPEAADAINLFSQRGVAVKIFTPDQPEETSARLREAGVSLQEDPELITVDSADFEGLTTAELGDLALTHTVFGSLSPQNSADIVHALREAGKSVGVAGDGVNDVAALRGAELAIVRKDSSPAVLAIGDIVLLEEGQATLARVLEKGQRIVKGLVDILKLYLTQILYLLFLIIAIQLWSRGFPYTSQQAGLIALITLTFPALALTLWASTGKLPRARLTKIIGNFVTPAAFSIAILGLLVYALTLERTGDLSYAQNVLTYALVTMGLLLVLTIKPPFYLHFRGLPKRGDIRPTILVVISAIVFILIARIPFFSEMFGIVPLQDPTDYALIVGAGLIWLIVVQVSWRLFPVVRNVSSEAVQVVDIGAKV